MTAADLAEISCELITETDSAILIDDGGTRIWLPKSQITGLRGDETRGDVLEIQIPEWLAIAKDLI